MPDSETTAEHRSSGSTRSAARALELKIPPLALVFLMALLMRLGTRFFAPFHFQFRFQSIASATIGLLGLAICTLGFVEFRRAKTTLNPTKPEASSALVRSGIYRHTRNPMYLGFLLVLTGWAVWTGNLVSFLALPAFVLYMNRFQIQPEERALASIFGAQFGAYCSVVRRWI